MHSLLEQVLSFRGSFTRPAISRACASPGPGARQESLYADWCRLRGKIGFALVLVLTAATGGDVVAAVADPQAVVDRVTLQQSGFFISPASLDGFSFSSRTSASAFSGRFGTFLTTAGAQNAAAAAAPPKLVPFLDFTLNASAGYESNPARVSNGPDPDSAFGSVDLAMTYPVERTDKERVSLTYEIKGRGFEGQFAAQDEIDHTFDASLTRVFSQYLEVGFDLKEVVTTTDLKPGSTTTEGSAALTYHPAFDPLDFAAQLGYTLDHNDFHTIMPGPKNARADRHTLGITGAYFVPPNVHFVQAEIDLGYNRIWNNAEGSLQSFTSDQVSVAVKDLLFPQLPGRPVSADLSYTYEWREYESASAKSGGINSVTARLKCDLSKGGDGSAVGYLLYTFTDRGAHDPSSGFYDQIAAVGIICKF